ncbi:MAG: bactofilin family protein [Nonlabens sp.]|uniref:bactofilin family protein n=1 Tax=Nonlabens sp. TaxID=1888209 RepID=UPI003EF7829E
MFNDKKSSKKGHMEAGKSQNRIGHGTVIEGDIKSKGGFRIDGTINGTLETPAKVVIGKDGAINGSLQCSNADIEGNFKGKLTVTGLLTLKSSAVIEGEVIISKLAVDPGATFNATCSMNTGVKNLSDSNKKGKSA